MKDSIAPLTSSATTASYLGASAYNSANEDEGSYSGGEGGYGSSGGGRGKLCRKRKIDDSNLTDSQKARKQKNRESAARSRQKQQERVNLLEAQLKDLANANASLTKELQRMRQENMALSQKMTSSSSVVTGSPVDFSSYSSSSSISSPISGPSIIEHEEPFQTISKPAEFSYCYRENLLSQQVVAPV